MKYARCECKDCGTEYLITFNNGVPKEKLYCVCCNSSNVKITWIDRAGFNSKI